MYLRHFLVPLKSLRKKCSVFNVSPGIKAIWFVLQGDEPSESKEESWSGAIAHDLTMDCSRMQTSKERNPNFHIGSVWAGLCTTSSALTFAHDGAEIIDVHITPCFRVVQSNQWQWRHPRSHVSDVPTRFFTYMNQPINQYF